MTTPDDEFRSTPGAIELFGDSGARRIGGLGVPYGVKSRLLPGGFREVLEKRAVTRTLRGVSDGTANVVSRLEHHPEWLLASTDSGTMRLQDEDDGLHYEVDLPNTTAGNDTYELVSTKRIAQASMAFRAQEQEFRHEGAVLVRYLSKIHLTEISPVSMGGYDSTSTALRHLANQFGEDPDDIERLARQGELRSLFTRTDHQVAAPPTIVPTPLEVAQRNVNQDNDDELLEVAEMRSDNGTLDLQARRDAHMARRWPDTNRQGDIDFWQTRNQSWGRKINLDSAQQTPQPAQHYPQPDDAARQQAAQIQQAAIARRTAQLAHDENVPVPYIDREAAEAKPLPQAVIGSPYRAAHNFARDGWIS